MDCREFLSRYSDYDDSLIAPEQADGFRAHMSVCPACARYDRVLRKGRMLARQLPAPDPSDDFVPRLRLRLADHRPLRRPSRSGSARPAGMAGPAGVRAALAALTVLLAVSAAVALLGLTPGFDAPGRSPAGSSISHPLALAAAMPTSHGDGHASHAPLSPILPARDGAAARDWGVERVDRGASSSYSPLIVGPPAYRGQGARAGASIPTH